MTGQEALVGGEERDQLRAGRVAEHCDLVGVAAVVGDVVVHPGHGGGHILLVHRVADRRLHPVVRQAVVHAHVRVPEIAEQLDLVRLTLPLVADAPAAAVHPDDDRCVAARRRGVHVELRQAGAGAPDLAVRDVAHRGAVVDAVGAGRHCARHRHGDRECATAEHGDDRQREHPRPDHAATLRGDCQDGVSTIDACGEHEIRVHRTHRYRFSRWRARRVGPPPSAAPTAGSRPASSPCSPPRAPARGSRRPSRPCAASPSSVR